MQLSQFTILGILHFFHPLLQLRQKKNIITKHLGGIFYWYISSNRSRNVNSLSSINCSLNIHIHFFFTLKLLIHSSLLPCSPQFLHILISYYLLFCTSWSLSITAVYFGWNYVHLEIWGYRNKYNAPTIIIKYLWMIYVYLRVSYPVLFIVGCQLILFNHVMGLVISLNLFLFSNF